MATYLEPVNIGDLVKSDPHPEISRDSELCTNPEANENTFVVGYPLDASGDPLLAAGIANTKGLLLRHTKMSASQANLKVLVLKRGPAVINADALPTTDYNGGAINKTNFITAIRALGIVVREEPDIQEEQTI